MKNFRKHHLLEIFNQSEHSSLPLDVFLRNYFRKHKALGSKDRQELCKTIYGIIRWRGLLDYLCNQPLHWKTRFETYQRINPIDFQRKTDIPLHIRVSFPKFIFDILREAYGKRKAIEICLHLNHPAPTMIRINPAKISRKDLLQKWQNIYDVSPCEQSPWGIIFHKKVNFFALPEFKSGFFEVQDEGSQLVANEIDPQPGDHVMDYCAGSAGKTLAFAHKLSGKGQLYVYDIRQSILLQAKKRLKRAGVQIAHPLTHRHLKRKSLHGKMNWLLLDVPCSGSGTLRRNPDMKWKVNPDTINCLIEEQRKIFSKALKFLHPNGKIVYATCSIFPQENEKQVSYYIKKYHLKLVKPPFLSFPENGKMDGFFSAILSY